MRLTMISGLTALAVIGTATSMLRSHSAPEGYAVGVRASAVAPQGAVRSKELPVHDFEDRSLEFTRETQR